MKSIKAIAVLGLLALSVEAHAEAMSCKLMEVLANNVAQQAYDETRNHIELIDQTGLFDTWILITNQLMQSYTKPEDAEFVGTVKFAVKTMIESKSEIEGKVAQEAYPKLLGKTTFNTCDHAEKQGLRT